MQKDLKEARAKAENFFNDVCPRIMNGNLDVVAICIFINVWEDDIWEDDTSKSSRLCDFCKMVVKKLMIRIIEAYMKN